MSIPKEPRQLMINLMYLVLTALLALNVSAEVMNAFFTLDEGNQQSMATVSNQLDATTKGVKDLLSDESKAKYQPIGPAIDGVREVVNEFNAYVDSVRDTLIDLGGNKNGEVDSLDYTTAYGKIVPKGKKNKDITTRYLVEQGRGEMLKQKVLDTRAAMLKVYDDLMDQHGETFGLKPTEVQSRKDAIAANMTLNIDDETWQAGDSDKKSWSEFKFKQMPLAAVMPLMSQMQTNAKTAEAAIVNGMAELTGGRTIEFDAFFPVVQAKKAYVIKGDPFEAEISVGSYSSQIQPENIKITVNGRGQKINDKGKATYKVGTTSTGKQTLKLTAAVTNPLTGEVTKGDGTYEYEVGVRSATVSADKMNVFYIGVDNPVSVTVAGVSSNAVKVNASGCSIKKSGKGYMVTASKPGEARVTVSGGGLPATNFDFRVKRIPDPVARLSKSNGGAMGNGEFKAQGGVGAFLDNFDFEATCKIQGFNLVHVAKRQDPVEAVNSGARYNDKAKRLVMRAKPGDIYYFDNVKARCPGDGSGRKINSMVFKIK